MSKRHQEVKANYEIARKAAGAAVLKTAQFFVPKCPGCGARIEIRRGQTLTVLIGRGKDVHSLFQIRVTRQLMQAAGYRT